MANNGTPSNCGTAPCGAATATTYSTQPVNGVCGDPTALFTYEALNGLSEYCKLEFMRNTYGAARDCYAAAVANFSGTDENKLIVESQRDAYSASYYNLNQAMIEYRAGLATDKNFLMTTALGDARDELVCSTRRSTPLGTIFAEMDGWVDSIKTGATDPEEAFKIDEVLDSIEAPNFEGIGYVEGEVAVPDVAVEKYDSCLDRLLCVYPKARVEEVVVDIPETVPLDPDGTIEPLELDLNVTISDTDITSGCANGEGLFDKLMTSIDSHVDLQFKNNRLDAKTFAVFYADAVKSSMQGVTDFLIREQQLKLDAARVAVAVAEFNQKQKIDNINLDLETRKVENEVRLGKMQVTKMAYEVELIESQTKLANLEVLEKVERVPLELSVLTQEAKGLERKIELTEKEIERTKASQIKIYRDIAEQELDGQIGRSKVSAEIENTRVATRVAKFDAILKKEQAYFTRIKSKEEQANGASTRRLANADVQSKNQQALLYKQQSKSYTQAHRENVAKLMQSAWGQQLDSAGYEGMLIEALKGPEMSSMLERLKLDSGL